MNDAIRIALLGLLAVPFGYMVNWLLHLKRDKSDIYKNLTESANMSIDYMQRTMERMTTELAIANGKIEDLGAEIRQLRHQNLLLLEENHALHKKVDDLRAHVNKTTGEIPVIEGTVVDPPSSPES